MDDKERLLEALSSLENIAVTLDRIDAFEDSFQKKISGIETRLTTLERSFRSYSDQLTRLEKLVTKTDDLMNNGVNLQTEIETFERIFKENDIAELAKSVGETRDALSTFNKTMKIKASKDKNPKIKN